MNTNSTGHPIYLTRIEDGSFLAVSIDSPRFCVGGANEQEAFEKAQRALRYYDSVKGELSVKPKKTSVISFVYQQKDLCAAY